MGKGEKMGSSHLRHATWSNLPGSIIHKICKHLLTRDQILRFKRVCKKWRSNSLPIPVNILSLTLPLSIPTSTTSKTLPFHQSSCPLALQVCSIYLITPSQPCPVSSVSLKPWMFMVQESNPGIIRLRHALTAKRVCNFPPTLDMTQFQAFELAQGYYFKNTDCVHKVLLCSSTSPSFIEVLVLYREGSLGKLTVRIPDNQARNDETDDEDEVGYFWKNLKLRDKRNVWFRYLDDIVEFKKMHCVVDRRGKLYTLDIDAMAVSCILVSEPICRGDIPSLRRKRLVVDSTSGELHLVIREHVKVKTSFKVYKFNEQCKRWDVLEHLGTERVLFVGVDHSFFAEAKYLPGCRGNCIVFSANCFTQYSGRNSPDGSLFGDENVEVGLYRLGNWDNFRLLSSAYPESSELIWPPPTWFSVERECNDDEETESGSSSKQALNEGSSSSVILLPDDHTEEMLTDSSGESSSHDDEDGCMLLDSPSQISSKTHDSDEATQSEEDEEETQRSSFNEQPCDDETNFSEETAKNNLHSGPPLAVEYEEHIGTSKMNNQNNEEDFDNSPLNSLGQDLTEEKVFIANSAPVTPSTVRPLDCEKCPTVTFEGVHIKSELLPTLETIRVKHGSLICDNTVRNKEIRACALELVAKLMIRLQNTTGRSLTDSQVDYMRTSLSDLRCVGLKVDWLVPAVEKALKLHESKALIESIMLLDKQRAQVDQEEKEFLARSSKVKQELEEDMACLSARIPFPEKIDLDDCLGGGLL